MPTGNSGLNQLHLGSETERSVHAPWAAHHISGEGLWWSPLVTHVMAQPGRRARLCSAAVIRVLWGTGVMGLLFSSSLKGCKGTRRKKMWSLRLYLRAMHMRDATQWYFQMKAAPALTPMGPQPLCQAPSPPPPTGCQGTEARCLALALSCVLLGPQAERLLRNESFLDTGQSQQVALQLRNATQHTDGYFGSDIKVAYQLSARLLEHESTQQGFGLAATQDVHFTEVTTGQGSQETVCLGTSEDSNGGRTHWHGEAVPELGGEQVAPLQSEHPWCHPLVGKRL